MLPTLANPSIHLGGIIGESKSEILNSISTAHHEFLPTFLNYKKINSDSNKLQNVINKINDLSLSYPLVAKPDIGQRGDGVKLVHTEMELKTYLDSFPMNQTVMIQEYVPFPIEAGILYYRYPDKTKGHIYSITLKEFPTVIGNGKNSLKELILRDPRANIIKNVYFKKHTSELDRILNKNEIFPLVFQGNHCQGAIFKNGKEFIQAPLIKRFDEIAQKMPEFYFGRFDVRFESLEDMLKGEAFKILEINGAGAESTHILGC